MTEASRARAAATIPAPSAPAHTLSIARPVTKDNSTDFCYSYEFVSSEYWSEPLLKNRFFRSFTKSICQIKSIIIVTTRW